MNAQDIKDRFNQIEADHKLAPASTVNDMYFKAALGAVSKAAGGDANRKLVQKALCGKTSSREMVDAERYAFCKFAAPNKINGHWGSDHGDKLREMCGLLLEDQARQPGASGGTPSSDESN